MRPIWMRCKHRHLPRWTFSLQRPAASGRLLLLLLLFMIEGLRRRSNAILGQSAGWTTTITTTAFSVTATW